MLDIQNKLSFQFVIMELLLQERVCNKTYLYGVTYTIFYWSAGSNYYHLTYDMMLPLYKHFYYASDVEYSPTAAVFMPVVETSRLQVHFNWIRNRLIYLILLFMFQKLNWETPAFREPTKYWVEMSKVSQSLRLQCCIIGWKSSFCISVHGWWSRTSATWFQHI